MHVLVACIGNRDPETEGSAGLEPLGPLRSARELKPDRVLLLHTPELRRQAETTAQRVRAELGHDRIELHQLNVANPALLDELTREVSRAAATLGIRPADTVSVCATSGTPQMFLAVTLDLMERRPDALHYQALHPDYPRTRDRDFDPIDPLLRRFDPDAIREREELRLAVEALANCRTRDAALLFARRLGTASRPPVAVIGQALGSALAAAEALERPSLDSECLEAAAAFANPDLGVRLDQIQAWLTLCAERRAYRVVETLAAAARQQKAGHTAAACLTAVMGYQALLAEQASLLGIQFTPPKATPEFGQLVPALTHRYRNVFQGGSAARKLVTMRNRMAHELRPPVGADTAVTDFLSWARVAIVRFKADTRTWPNPGDCPTWPENVAIVAALLAQEAGVAAPVPAN